ncbi:MAG: OmpA family protein [Muribaculaceae bacterium]|nr:OmpA family protein [Muribaculaceae bacterium]
MKLRKYIMIAACVMASMALHLEAKVVDIYDLSLDENLETPVIKNEKQALKIQDFQHKLAVSLIESNYDVESMRDGEILVITITSDQLFEPNDSVLTYHGKELLRPMLKYLMNPGFYKMLLVMHSDNTGSESYTMKMACSRVNAVFDWFDDNGDVDYVVPYALGASEPYVKNDSMENRRKNRRLEIYLVPNTVMIEQAKRGKIIFSTTNKK